MQAAFYQPPKHQQAQKSKLFQDQFPSLSIPDPNHWQLLGIHPTTLKGKNQSAWQPY